MLHIFSLVSRSRFSEVALGTALTRVLRLARQHRVELEGNFATLMFSIVVLEGVGRQLDPNLALFDQAIRMLMRDTSLHPAILRTPGSLQVLKRYCREKMID